MPEDESSDTSTSSACLEATLLDVRRRIARKRPDTDQQMAGVLERYYEALHDCHHRGDWKEHNRQTLGLIFYARHIAISNLCRYQHLLHRYVNKHGVAPYLSWLIEYGYRLSRSKARAMRTCYRDLIALYRAKAALQLDDAAVVIRYGKDNSYRLVSMNLGYAVAHLLLSAFGWKQSLIGYLPWQYLRIAALLGDCAIKRASERDIASVAGALAAVRQGRKAADPCTVLADHLRESLGGQAFGELGGLLGDAGGRGARVGNAECLAHLLDERPQVGMIDRFERYTECRSARRDTHDSRVVGPQLLYDGQGNQAGGWGSFTWNGRKYEQDGYTVGYKWGQEGIIGILGSGTFEETYTSEDGGTIAIGRTTYTNGQRGDTTVSMFDTDTGNKTEEVTLRQDGTLKQHDTYDPATGAWRSTANYDEQGRITSFTDSQGSATYTHNNGTTTVTTTTTNSDGTTTTVTTTVDEDGNEVAGSTSIDTSASTPVDDYVPDECAAIMFEDLTEAQTEHTVSKLDTLIYPDPEAPSGSIDNPCFGSFAGSPARKCASVAALCLEGYVLDENCRCTRAGGRVQVDPNVHAKRCAQMECGEGAECDGATGTCRSIGSGTLEPGIDVGPVVGPKPSALIPAMPDVLAQFNVFKAQRRRNQRAGREG